MDILFVLSYSLFVYFCIQPVYIIVDIVCYILSFYVYHYFDSTGGNELITNITNQKSKAFLKLVVHVGRSFTIFFFQIVTKTFTVLAQSFYVLLPLLLFVTLFSVVSDDFGNITSTFVNAYNNVLSNNIYLRSIQNSTWLVKIFIELVVPLWNFVYDSISGSKSEILRVFTSSNNIVAVFDIFSNAAFFMMGISSAVARWINVNFNNCRYSNIKDDIELFNSCMAYENREIDIDSTTLHLRAVALNVHVLLNGILCPSVASILSIIMYPLYDENVYIIIHNAVNVAFQVSCCWTFWDITHTRC